MVITSAPPGQESTVRGLIPRLVVFAAIAALTLAVIGYTSLLIPSALLIAALALVAAGILANVITIRIFDRRPLSDIGLQLNSRSGWHFLIGSAIAAAAASSMMLIPLLFHFAHFENRQLSTQWNAATWGLSLISYAALLLMGAIGEETMYRGYAFQAVLQRAGIWWSIGLQAVVFAWAHAASPGMNTLGLANTVLWGVVLGYAFLRSRDLWLPIGLHWGWNIVLPLFGADLSGITIEITRYKIQWGLSQIWSGGAYGPEGGLLGTLGVILVAAVLPYLPVRPQIAQVASRLNQASA